MKNVRIIEYPRSYQVRIYWYDKDFLLGYYLASDDKERRERRKRIREELERYHWNYDEFVETELDWDEIDEWFEQQRNAKRMEYGAKAASRAKTNVYYLARSNEWEWFVTLTLDGDKMDRYDFEVVSKRVKKWFDNLKQRKAPDMYYLIVPEQHKDGAWHFHGLIGGCAGLSFVNSGKRTNKKSGRKIIYNFEDWKYGFSTATKVDDTERVSSYICKYITKTLAANTERKHRYWASKNCKRAEITENCLSDAELMSYKESLYDVMSYKKRVTTEWCSIDYFEIPKGDNNG